jgi:predicted amino acid dehydrogenase
MAGALAGVSPRSKELALVGHLATLADYTAVLNAVRGSDLPPLSTEDVARIVEHVSPMPICDIEFRSTRGHAIAGRYVETFMLVDDAWSAPRAMTRVRAACAAAAPARVGVLGGFTSIVAQRERLSPEELRLPFTTGNTLTAAIIAQQVLSVVGRPTKTGALCVAIVGAAGDLGTGVARLLDREGYRLRLIAREVDRSVLRLASELSQAKTCTLAEATDAADLFVLAASATRPVRPENGFRDKAVLDAGHPPNARASGAGRYARAGRAIHARPPCVDLEELLECQYEPGETHGCLAEGVTLALERRFEAYSRGRGLITPEAADEILKTADRHGIAPAPLHWR